MEGDGDRGMEGGGSSLIIISSFNGSLSMSSSILMISFVGMRSLLFLLMMVFLSVASWYDRGVLLMSIILAFLDQRLFSRNRIVSSIINCDSGFVVLSYHCFIFGLAGVDVCGCNIGIFVLMFLFIRFLAGDDPFFNGAVRSANIARYGSLSDLWAFFKVRLTVWMVLSTSPLL
jgi:hypothetical protein